MPCSLNCSLLTISLFLALALLRDVNFSGAKWVSSESNWVVIYLVSRRILLGQHLTLGCQMVMTAIIPTLMHLGMLCLCNLDKYSRVSQIRTSYVLFMFMFPIGVDLDLLPSLHQRLGTQSHSKEAPTSRTSVVPSHICLLRWELVTNCLCVKKSSPPPTRCYLCVNEKIRHTIIINPASLLKKKP